MKNIEKKENDQKLKKSEYEKMGRLLERVAILGYSNKKRFIYYNFLKGILIGIGSAIGATLIIALILYALSYFSELPWIGQIFQNIQTTIEKSQSIAP